MKGDKNLWDLAIKKAEDEKDEIHISEDYSILIAGSKNSGKTSMILRYLDRDEHPKPTVALEYTFGRRAKGHNIAKDVGHIWELGGGTWLSKLMDIPINPESIMHTSLILVLDLSKPEELWFTLESLLNAGRSRVENVIAEIKLNDSHIRDKLKKHAWERIGTDHTDKSVMDPFLIPLVIIGGKYDIFQNFDSEKRKVICKTLRFVAHTHGASLQFFSTHMDSLMKRTQGLINHHLFQTTPSKMVQLEHSKPIFVAAGLDSLQQIGNPPLSDDNLGRVHARTPMDLWKKAYTSYFPQENTNNPAMVEDPGKDPKFTEPAIDALRVQKDEELDRYQRLADRRSKESSMY